MHAGVPVGSHYEQVEVVRGGVLLDSLPDRAAGGGLFLQDNLDAMPGEILR